MGHDDSMYERENFDFRRCHKLLESRDHMDCDDGNGNISGDYVYNVQILSCEEKCCADMFAIFDCPWPTDHTIVTVSKIIIHPRQYGKSDADADAEVEVDSIEYLDGVDFDMQCRPSMDCPNCPNISDIRFMPTASWKSVRHDKVCFHMRVRSPKRIPALDRQ
jgi:hypothetical protein